MELHLHNTSRSCKTIKNNNQNKTEHRVLILLELAYLFGSKYKHEETLHTSKIGFYVRLQT